MTFEIKGKTVLITGATSGIGLSTARVFAKEGYKLVLCGRRQDRLDALESELGKQTDVTTLNFDVRDKQKVFDAISGLPAPSSTVDILVNNVGTMI